MRFTMRHELVAILPALQSLSGEWAPRVVLLNYDWLWAVRPTRAHASLTASWVEMLPSIPNLPPAQTRCVLEAIVCTATCLVGCFGAMSAARNPSITIITSNWLGVAIAGVSRQQLLKPLSKLLCGAWLDNPI